MINHLNNVYAKMVNKRWMDNVLFVLKISIKLAIKLVTTIKNKIIALIITVFLEIFVIIVYRSNKKLL